MVQGELRRLPEVAAPLLALVVLLFILVYNICLLFRGEVPVGGRARERLVAGVASAEVDLVRPHVLSVLLPNLRLVVNNLSPVVVASRVVPLNILLLAADSAARCLVRLIVDIATVPRGGSGGFPEEDLRPEGVVEPDGGAALRVPGRDTPLFREGDLLAGCGRQVCGLHVVVLNHTRVVLLELVDLCFGHCVCE